MVKGSPRTRRRSAAVALALLALAVAGPLAAGPAAAEAVDGAVLLVEPHYPALASPDVTTLRPVTGADGRDYYLLSVRLSVLGEDGRWSFAPVAVADTFLRVVPPGGEPGPWLGAADHALAFAGDGTRVLVALPKDARADGVALLEASSGGRVGYFNVLKVGAPRPVADALDAVPSPVRFNETSAGPYRYSVTVEVLDTDAGYDVRVTPLSPFVERTTVTTPNGSAEVALDRASPAVASFLGEPEGIVARTASTRFSTSGKGTFGGPVAGFLLCKTAVPCVESVARVLTRENVTGDARPSASPPGENLTHEWDWGDGATTAAALARHDWQAGGLYTVTLTVRDESGRVDEASIPLTVLNQAPSGTVSVTPNPPTRATATTLRVTASDPDGRVVKYQWYLDGSPAPADAGLATLVVAPGVLGLGPHTAKVLIRDDLGAYGSATLAFTVVNLPPVAVASAERASVQPGVPLRFKDESVDADGGVVAWSWEFGDGATSTSPSPTHAYAAEGAYAPVLTVRDADGGVASVALPPIVVDATAPTLAVEHPPPPDSGWHASGVRFTVKATDDRDLAPVVTATVGDHSFTVENGMFTVTAQGESDVTVTATDAAGNARSWSTVVRIDGKRPALSFSPPSPFATGVERLVVAASDEASGVALIELLLDQRVVAARRGADALAWDWDTRDEPIGVHRLAVRVTDRAGHLSAMSWSVTVLNLPGGIPPPSLP